MRALKLLFTVTLSAIVLFLGTNISYASPDKPSVYFNNQKMDIYAVITPMGVTYVPFRPIFEKLNMTVNWDNKKKSVTATNGNTTIVLTNNSSIAYVNNQEVKLIQPPMYNPYDKLFYVNLRFVAESTGAKVNWSKNETDANINITNPNLK